MRPLRHEKDLEIDYSVFDDRFDNMPTKQGPEISEFDLERRKYAMENALSFEPKLEIPDFKELTPNFGKKQPMTFRWYKRSTSYERSGFFNISSLRLANKLRFWLFYPCVIWGMTAHVVTGYYFDNYDHTDDRDMGYYDKLAPRPLPSARVWARPG